MYCENTLAGSKKDDATKQQYGDKSYIQLGNLLGDTSMKQYTM